MFFNYTKPGKGVKKRDPNTPRWKVFWDVFPRKLWDMFKLNLLYLITSLPILVILMIVVGIITNPVIHAGAGALGSSEIAIYDILLRFVVSFLFMVFFGVGPTTAGYSYIVRQHANERPCTLISDYFERIKLNWKQSTLMLVIDMLIVFVSAIAIRFYGGNGYHFLKYVVMVVVIVFAMMHSYIYQMMITFDLPLKAILKNALLLTFGKAPMSLLLMICNAVLYMVIPYCIVMYTGSVALLVVFALLEFFILPPITGFINVFCVIPVLRKHVQKETE